MEVLNKVLCVNDSEMNLFIFERLIEQTAFAKEVVSVSNGQEAIDYYLKLVENSSEGFYHPDLILLDIDMPVMNGWDFLSRFTQSFLPLFPNTQVVITSFSIDDKDFEKAKQYPYIIDFRNTPMTIDYFKKLKPKIMDAILLAD